MKSEQEVKKQLKIAEKELRDTRKRFVEHDNIDDMHAIDTLQAEIDALKWVLGK